MIISSKLLFKWKIAIVIGLVIFILTPIIISTLIKPSTDLLLKGESLKSDYRYEISVSKINVGENIATVTITP
jgi:hypothetical protein